MLSGKDTKERLRALLLMVLLVGSAGIGLELLLLGHFEDWWQRLPLAVLGIGIVSTAVVLLRPTKKAVQALRSLALAFLASGVLGSGLHFKGNMEFELELHASMRGLELVWESLRGAFPALAPGAMAQLGLLGLVACYRHPELLPAETQNEEG